MMIMRRRGRGGDEGEVEVGGQEDGEGRGEMSAAMIELINSFFYQSLYLP